MFEQAQSCTIAVCLLPPSSVGLFSDTTRHVENRSSAAESLPNSFRTTVNTLVSLVTTQENVGKGSNPGAAVCAGYVVCFYIAIICNNSTRVATLYIEKYFQKGLFKDPRTEKASRRAMFLSVLVALLLLVQTVIALINSQAAADVTGVNPIGVYATVIITQLMVCLIPYCGYVGAKDNDASMLFAACLCSSLCVIFALFGFLVTLVKIDGYGSESCERLREIGLEDRVVLCYVNTGLNVGLTILFAFCAYYTNQLYQYTEIVQVGSPDIEIVQR